MATLTQGTTGPPKEVTTGLKLQLAICKAEDILTNVLELAQEKFNLVTEALRLRIQNEEYAKKGRSVVETGHMVLHKLYMHLITRLTNIVNNQMTHSSEDKIIYYGEKLEEMIRFENIHEEEKSFCLKIISEKLKVYYSDCESLRHEEAYLRKQISKIKDSLCEAKKDKIRLEERKGIFSIKTPEGTLLALHKETSLKWAQQQITSYVTDENNASFSLVGKMKEESQKCTDCISRTKLNCHCSIERATNKLRSLKDFPCELKALIMESSYDFT